MTQLMARTYKRKISFRFAHPVAAVWPALADTARFNEASGFPKHVIEEVESEDGSVRMFAQGNFSGVQMAWEEFPVEWVYGQWFWHWREFTKGPFRTIGAMVDFEETESGSGCVCHYEVSVEARSAFGHLILNTGFFPKAEKDFRTLCAQVSEWAAGVSSVPYKVEPHRPGVEEMARINGMVRGMESSAYGHGVAERLVEWVLRAQEVDLVRIRPLALADELGIGRRHMVEAALQAVRVGLLQQRWDLLCPRCRGAKVVADGLDQLPEAAHCSSCQIDYSRDFDSNVELTFTPSSALRAVYDGEYCLGGPMTTPHVMAQVRVQAGNARSWPGVLPSGSYRARDLRGGPYVDFEHGGMALPSFQITEDGVTLAAGNESGALVFSNRDRADRYVVVERRDWAADALSAAHATTLQAFRDLCATECLRPGDSTGVSQVTLVFTDLLESTALFESEGDAVAFGKVRAHFAWIAQIVREHDGGIVKTMGDAVLAAFMEPRHALAAALAIQGGIEGFNSCAGSSLKIRIGMNSGPALAVTLNGRLDYFGHTANLAARLEGVSRGGDIVVSENIRNDPTVRALADANGAVREEKQFKGIGEPIAFWRIGGTQDT